ncbi:MAG TPA: hypothetical protein VFQ61_14025 [Polyangiaceae bacterium]|nr:hypothetical protein [Polyangiaceae bacterium]
MRGLLVGGSVGYDLWTLRTLGAGIGVRADYLPFAEMSGHAASIAAFAGLTYY